MLGVSDMRQTFGGFVLGALPMEVDTGANESGHKPTKKAAMLTQRIEEKFNYQTTQWLQEMHVLELAMAVSFGLPRYSGGC